MTAIHILGELKAGPWGGGNQFLKALREYLRGCGAYAETLDVAQAVLANGHQWGPYLYEMFRAKRVNPNLVVLHRVDGPMAVVRGREDNRILDDAIIRFNRHFADGTIFQSNWSRGLCLAGGMDANKRQTVLFNAPDPSLFHPSTVMRPTSGKVRIVSTSWSSNWRKGFDVFEYLDNHLDFSKYEFTFVGNSRISFRNVRHLPAIPSDVLADELRAHDIFLQASQMEACSNSLIEAMNCGLVPVARNNSSHPEIVGDAGVLYEGVGDVLDAIEKAVSIRADCLARLPGDHTLTRIGHAYLEFAADVSRRPVARPTMAGFAATWIAWKVTKYPGFAQKLTSFCRFDVNRLT